MEVLAQVVRSGFVESVHRGTVVHIEPNGSVIRSWGDPDTLVFPRSTNKPMQALGMLRSGLDLQGELLALSMASHSGEDFHVAAVDRILAAAGLGRDALQTPPSYPLDPKQHAEVLRRGGGREPILMDCSGKHAAMLLTCVRQGWSIENYLAPDHPLQQQITETFCELTGGAADPIGVDGCGAPLLGTSLAQLATAVGRVARGEAGPESQALAASWLAHPEFVSGTRRGELKLMQAVRGLRAKTGAESLYVAALPDNTVLALKIEDGGERPLDVVMHAAVRYAGFDAPLLHETPEVLGGGQPVGQVQAVI